MKQKILVLLLGAALCFSLAACGGADSSSEASVPIASSVEQSSQTEEAVSSDVGEAVQTETVETDDFTLQYDAQFTYNADSDSIVFEQAKSFVNILTGDSAAGIVESTEETDWALLQHKSILSGLGATVEEGPTELQIGGKPALRSQVSLNIEGIVLDYDLVTFEAGESFYGLAYASVEGAPDHEQDFLNILDSVSFK